MAATSSTTHPSRSAINARQLVKEKLLNSNKQFSLEERIAMLFYCIRAGDRKISEANNKEIISPIVFLGNTGAGKSTLINYLAGCEMQLIRAKDIGMSSVTDLIIVKEKSILPQITQIGHSNISETFMPQVEVVDNRAFCDCPGFLDNRGTEINVANIVNIRRVMLMGRGPKVVVLVNWNSLKADKSKGLIETVNTLTFLFRTPENMVKNKQSILFGITQMQSCSRRLRRKESLDELRNWIRVNETGRSESQQRVYELVAERLFIYDPLDNEGDLLYPGALNRQQLLGKIDELLPIPDAKQTFQVALSKIDKQNLREICDGIIEKIVNYLNNEEYEKANELVNVVEHIKIIDHPDVAKLVESCKRSVNQHFQVLVQKVDQLIVENPSKISYEAANKLQIISSGLGYFNSKDRARFESEIGLLELQNRHRRHSRTIQFHKEQAGLEFLVREFLDFCYAFDIESAKQHLNTIKVKIICINKKFKNSNLKCELPIEQLTANLQAAITRKESLEKSEQRIKDLNKKLNYELEKTVALSQQNEQSKKNVKMLESDIKSKQSTIEDIKEKRKNALHELARIKQQTNQQTSSPEAIALDLKIKALEKELDHENEDINDINNQLYIERSRVKNIDLQKQQERIAQTNAEIRKQIDEREAKIQIIENEDISIFEKLGIWCLKTIYDTAKFFLT